MEEITKTTPTTRGRPPKNPVTPPTDERRVRNERVAIATQSNLQKKRVGLTKKGLLGFPQSVEKEEGMHYCWAKDDDKNNLQRYLDAAYQPALNLSQKKEVRPAGDGNMLILMKIKEEYYQEDYAHEQSLIVGRESQDQTIGQAEYLPRGSQRVLSRNTH